MVCNPTIIIERGPVPVPKIVGRGRKRGSGFNLRMLAKMKPGDCVSEIPRNKMLSVRNSAYRAGIKIRIRKLPVDGQQYAIWKL